MHQSPKVPSEHSATLRLHAQYTGNSRNQVHYIACKASESLHRFILSAIRAGSMRVRGSPIDCATLSKGTDKLAKYKGRRLRQHLIEPHGH